MSELLARLGSGDFDAAIADIKRRQRHLKWKRLPKRLILLRHGESEGNVNRSVYTSKGDSHLELTPAGLEQAKAAGARLKALIGEDRVFIVVSPFERTVQTLLGLQLGGLLPCQVATVHISSQIREQEFGNFQSVGLQEAARAEQDVVGRFYYRRPNAESSADVFDRVGAFCSELVDDLLPSQEEEFDTCLIVTHGLTMRLILMKLFQWSVETFETVWNVDNCHHIALEKDIDKMTYRFCREMSFPQVLPWSTRKIWIVFKSRQASEHTAERLRLLRSLRDSGGCLAPKPGLTHGSSRFDEERFVSLPGNWNEFDRLVDDVENQSLAERADKYTVLDYLGLPQPRASQTVSLSGKLIPGHAVRGREEMWETAKSTAPIDWDDVELVDWWGPHLSFKGKMLRMQAGPHRRFECHFAPPHRG